MNERAFDSMLPLLVNDLDRALCRDRSHAVISSPGARGALPLERLPRELPSGAQLMVVGADEVDDLERLTQRIARKLATTADQHDPAPPIVMIVHPADTLDAEQLAWIGELAGPPQDRLRLALWIRDASPENAGRVISALGAGAQKLEVETERRPAPVARLDRARAAARPARSAIPPAISARRPLPAAPRPSGGIRMATFAAACMFASVAVVVPSNDGTQEGSSAAFELAKVSTAPTAADDLPPLEVAAPPAAPREATPNPSVPVPDAEATISEVATELEPEAPQDDAARDAHVQASAQENVAADSLPAEATVDNEAHESLEASEHATPAPRIVVSINAHPWAFIQVDGETAGATPIGTLELTQGTHHFQARLPDGQVVERDVEIGPYRHRVVFP